jgi:hypothetical protein
MQRLQRALGSEESSAVNIAAILTLLEKNGFYMQMFGAA